MSDNSRVRVSIIGVVIVALFCSLFARLWFLQMGPDSSLKAEAVLLGTSKLQTESPRGRIIDRNGVVLVQDRAAWAVTLDRNLPEATRTKVIGQLSELLGKPAPELQAAYDDPRVSPLLPATLDVDVPLDQRLAILESPDEFPGVRVGQLTIREYPAAREFNNPGLASQLLGYVGEIDGDQLKVLKDKGYQAGDVLGRTGVEAAYESSLRGVPQVAQVEVDPTGKQVGPSKIVQEGRVGNDLVLAIDAKVQNAADAALAEGITHARGLQNRSVTSGFERQKAPGGAVVVLDARDGSVVAMASNPSFPVENWVNGVSQAQVDGLNDPASGFPLVNRVTQGQYAPGSTFKLVPSIAQSRYGYRAPDEYYNDSGSVEIGNQKFTNDNNTVNGPVNLEQALTVSSDTYYYTAGNSFWLSWNRGDKERGLGLQQEALDLGFGAKTGIELDETVGRIPDPEWKKRYSEANYKDERARRENSTWYPGDDVAFAVGQKDVLVTPLQLANAYATFANNGTLNTPHVAKEVRDPVSGQVVQTIAPPPKATVTFDPAVHDAMSAGFKGVVQNRRGTAYGAFAGFPFSKVPGGVAGKTGTAQVEGKASTSLFASYFPADAPEYVVLAIVEEGGYGAEVAAPIVRQTIESLLGLEATEIRAQAGRD